MMHLLYKNRFLPSLLSALMVTFLMSSCQNQDSSKNAKVAITTTTGSSDAFSNGMIAYVNIDTLALQYDLYVDIKAKNERVQLEAARQFEQAEINLQSKVESFQKRAQQGLLSENAAKKEQQDLQGEMQMIERQKISKREAIMLQNEKDLDKVFANIESVLEDYKAEKGYQVVLGTQKGMATILYADKELDITEAVLQRLNEKYQSEKDSISTAN